MCDNTVQRVKAYEYQVEPGKWQELFRTAGSIIPRFGGQAHSYRVTVKGRTDVLVKWRRYSGAKLVAEGSFIGSTDFNIPPTDKRIRVDARVPEALTIVATPIPVPQRDPPKRLLAELKKKSPR